MKTLNNPVVVSGMHRSGTSLLAGLLHNSGISMGNNLMAASASNIKGHFEDLNFLKFHEDLLTDNELDPFGWTTRNNLFVSKQRVEEARKLISRYDQFNMWGWKDPRTILFLDFWSSLLPNARFIFSYRTPWEVADSLLRRGASCDEIFFHNPGLSVQLWIHYNQQLLKFLSANKDKCVLVNAVELAKYPIEFLQELKKRFSLNLRTIDADFCEQKLLCSDISNTPIPEILLKEFPEISSVLEELSQHTLRLANNSDDSATQGPEIFNSYTLNNWANLRRGESEIKKLRTEMNHVCGTLDSVLKDIESIKDGINPPKPNKLATIK